MKKRILALMMVAALSITVFAGCGDSGSTGSTGGGDAATTEDGGEGADEGTTTTTPAAGGTELRMNVTTAETGTWMNGAQYFADTIAEQTGGKYTVTIYPNEQLSGGNQSQGVQMVQQGATDVDIHSTIIWTAVDQRLTVANMPWLITTYEEADAVFAGEGGEAFMEIMREAGVVPLAFGESGFRQLTNSKRAVASPEDMVGLKIRVPGIAMYIDLYTQLGADPTAMNWAETFTAMQQGAVDGQENPLDIIYTNRVQEVQDYLTMWNYSYDVLIFSVSQRTWDGLTDEEQALFQETATEAMRIQKEDARRVNEEYLALLADEMEVTELTAEQMDAFKEAAVPVYDAYRGEIGEDLYRAFGYEG